MACMPGQSALSVLGARMQVQPAMARDLFPAGFVPCWSELDDWAERAERPGCAHAGAARDGAGPLSRRLRAVLVGAR